MTTDEKHQYWYQQIDAWQQSGKPQRTFCMEHELSYSTFSYWRTKINRAKQRENKWLPVHLTASSVAVTVCLPGGIRLEVPAQALGDVLPVVYRSLQDNG
jgi:hypothetical protein